MSSLFTEGQGAEANMTAGGDFFLCSLPLFLLSPSLSLYLRFTSVNLAFLFYKSRFRNHDRDFSLLADHGKMFNIKLNDIFLPISFRFVFGNIYYTYNNVRKLFGVGA